MSYVMRGKDIIDMNNRVIDTVQTPHFAVNVKQAEFCSQSDPVLIVAAT